ncbi:MAG: alpha-N-arabinofuranosidase, partial [Clostridiales bacterium]|nr:alpha-N-arabinofuranosidase [Clostridiales bacterium]
EMSGKKVCEAVGEMVTGDMHDKNTFEDPDAVKITEMQDIQITESGLKFTVPACTVAHLTVR